jgi:hypothetical protein
MKTTRSGLLLGITVALTMPVIGFVYGVLCSEWRLPPYDQMRDLWVQYKTRDLQQGRWREARPDPKNLSLLDEQYDTIEQLQSIGYLAGYELAEGSKGVVDYLPDLAYEGLNLYTSGHGQEAILITMEGEVLHKWSYDLRHAFPELTELKGAKDLFWVNVHLFPNGDLLAIVPDHGLVKIDRHSRLLWAKNMRCHHDMSVDEKGRIYILTAEPKVLARIHGHKPVREEFIAILDSEGSLLRKVSLLEAFERSSHASILNKMPASGDIFHANTLERFDGSLEELSPIFKGGNILVSMRSFDAIAIVDMDREEVVWALTGQWIRQHRPVLLDDGDMLLFDNLGHRGVSKVIQFDPFTQEIRWAYEGDEENGFFSETCGANQRLPNGNTLITESDSGRAFEVTPDKRIVWEFHNPARTGDDDELIATLFEVVRLPPELPSWLKSMEEGS